MDILAKHEALTQQQSYSGIRYKQIDAINTAHQYVGKNKEDKTNSQKPTCQSLIE